MANILTCYYRPKPGGFCQRLLRAIRALLAAGHSVHYVAVTPFPIAHARCVFHRFPWPLDKTDRWLFWALFHLAAPVMLCYLAVRHRITHAFGFSPTYAFLLQPARWVRSLALTCFLNGDFIDGHRAKQRPCWLIRLEMWIEGAALRGTHVVSVAPHLLDAVVRRHPGAALLHQQVLPYDLPPRVPGARCVNRPLRLALVGTLEPIKNQLLALALVHRCDPDALRLDIYGVGPEGERLRGAAAALHLGNRVAFRGWVPSDRIWPQVDLLLMPSLSEGMPNAVLEAIAAGVPVLASDIPAHRPILPHDQLLPLDCPHRWQAALAAIMADPQRALSRIRKHQWQATEKLRFDWDARVTALIVHPGVATADDHPSAPQGQNAHPYIK